jgi:hypothetical protein
MTKAKAVVARERRTIGFDELLPHERREHRCHLRVVGRECLHGATVEDLALDRRPLEDAPLGLVEPVESRGEHCLQRGRDGHLVGVLRDREQLFEEQWVATRGACDLVAQVAGGPTRDQLFDVRLAERMEPEGHGPGGTQLGQLRSGDAEQQDPAPGRQERDMLDKVEERLLAPLDVIEDDHEGLLRSRVLQRLPERPRDVLRGRGGVALAQQGADRRDGRFVRRERVDLLQHLDDWPVRDAFAVRRAARVNGRRTRPLQRLADQPGLPDTGVPDDRDQLAALLLARVYPRASQQLELVAPADEWTTVTPSGNVEHTDEPEGWDGIRLAFQDERLHRLGIHGFAGERERGRTDQHLAGRCSLLESRRHVDRVTRRQPLFSPRHDLAGRHADATLELELGQRVPHLDRRAQRAQGVVLVHGRHAEHGHHGVADELLDAASVALDNALHALEVGREQCAQPLGIDRFAERGRAR